MVNIFSGFVGIFNRIAIWKFFRTIYNLQLIVNHIECIEKAKSIIYGFYRLTIYNPVSIIVIVRVIRIKNTILSV